MKVYIPIQTVSPNKNEHWGKKSRRHADQRLLLKIHLKHLIGPETLPCTIRFTRIAPGKLDPEENLPMSFKHSKDVVADLLVPGLAFGRADGDPRIRWDYDQRRGKPREYGIEVEVIRD